MPELTAPSMPAPALDVIRRPAGGDEPDCRYCRDGQALADYDPPCPQCAPRAEIDAYLRAGEDLEHARWNAGQQTAPLLDQLATPEPGIGRS